MTGAVSHCPDAHCITAPPRCPICAGDTVRASLHTPSSFWRCKICRTAHLHPQPTQESLEQYYEAFHLSRDQGGVFEDFETRSAADFPRKARIVAGHLGKIGDGRRAPRTVLDFGCGKGLFVREVSDLGLEAEGIDLSRTATRAGTEELNIEGLRAGNLDEQDDWYGKFDAATAWATIEHLPNPRSFLKSLRRVLKPRGYLFIDTGLADDFLDRHAPGLIQWYDIPQHLFVFSRSGIERLLSESGFEVVAVDANFERSRLRRLVKCFRNRLLVAASACLFRVALGANAYGRMRMESKMPFGSLMFVVARMEAER